MGNAATGVCRDCARDYVTRLQWLRLIGMPTLRQVAYRQVDLGEHAARSGNAGVAPIPLRMDAEQTYIDVERDLQHLAGRIGLKPIGHDDLERPRTLRDWAWILPRLILRQHDLLALDTADDDLHTLTGDCELFLVKLVFRFRGGDGMLDSLSGEESSSWRGIRGSSAGARRSCTSGTSTARRT